MLAIDRQAFFKLPANGLGPQQRQFQFAELAADDARGALLQGLAQGIQRRRLSGGHLLEDLGGKKQVAGRVRRREPGRAGRGPPVNCGSRSAAAQGRRGDERQVQQVRLAGIIVFPAVCKRS